jgi:hypothetical protein
VACVVRGGQLLLGARNHTREHRLIERILASEEVGGRAAGDAGGLADLLHARALEALTREEVSPKRPSCRSPKTPEASNVALAVELEIVEHEHPLAVETRLVVAAHDERPVQALLELHGLVRVRVVPERPRIREREPVLKRLPGLDGPLGSEGFSGTHDILIVLAWVISLPWMIWLVVVAWRIQDSRPVAWPDEGVGRTAATSPTITHR